MKIIVTTCPAYEYLVPGFIERYNQHWGDEFLLDVAQEGEAWSDQLLRICRAMHDEYFVRLCEDFYISGFNRNAFACLQMLLDKKPDRIGLQSVKDYIPPCTEPAFTDNHGHAVEKMKHGSEYMCSMEASIYRRQFLIDNLILGRHIWETEIEMSKKTPKATIFIPTEKILIYKDATRRGVRV